MHLLPLEVEEGADSFSVRFRVWLVTPLGSLLLHLVMCLARYSTWLVALVLVDVLGSLLCLARCSCTC